MKLTWNHLIVLSCITALLSLPIVRDDYILHIAILFLFYGGLALSWDLLFGYTGLLNFGFAGIIGFGAYVAALMSMKLGISPWLGLFISGITATLVSVPISLVAIRLRGAYMAIATLALGQILQLTIARPLDWITKGYDGLWGIPSLLPSVARTPYYYIILAMVISTVFIKYKLINSTYGLYLRAIREDDVAAQALGINIVKYKLFCFFLSSFLGGIFAGFYAYYIMLLTPDLLGVPVTFEILSYNLLGGSGSISGALIGSFILITLSELLRPLAELRFVLYGAMIMIVVLFWRGGIAGFIRRRFKVSI